MKYSFGMLKPDCIERKLEKKVFKKIESAGFVVLKTKSVLLKQDQIDIIYSCCKANGFYKDMSKFLLSGKCEVFIVESDDAIKKLNDLVGHRDPLLAKERTIRRCFGETIRRNIIHSSRNKYAFLNESSLFFEPMAIVI